MPSPFPGMDPYLEGGEWMSFHAEFCVEIARQLRPKLRPRYIAQTIKRFVTDTTDDLVITNLAGRPHSRNLFPDVGIARITQRPTRELSSPIAVLEPTLQMATVMPEFVPQYAVEIRDVEQRQLVTLIEVLSPANKVGEGYEEYVTKRQQILRSSAHLMEIDLLRKGRRVPMRRPLPDSPYYVFLSRQEKRPLTDIWQIALDESLPTVSIPLLPPDNDTSLDLQQAFTNVYDSVGYDLLLNYEKHPDVALENDIRRWAEQLLKTDSTQSFSPKS